MNFFVQKMKSLIEGIPKSVTETLLKWFSDAEKLMEILKDRFTDILSGSRKKEVTDWWLSYIEQAADEFLTKKDL